MPEEKEPFVASTDRPNVNLNPDAPISELRVRDLHALLQSSAQFKNTMEKVSFPEKQFKELKFEKPEYVEKYLYYDKHFKTEMKLEKLEHKDWKAEILDKSAVMDAQPLAQQQAAGPGGIDQLVQTVSKLTEQVNQLSQQVEQLKQKLEELNRRKK